MKITESMFPKAKTLKLNKITLPCQVEEKLDGERMILKISEAYGRRKNNLGQYENKWDQLPSYIKDMANEEFVDGELVVLGGTSSDVKTALIEEWENLEFIAHSVTSKLYEWYPDQHFNYLYDEGFIMPDRKGIFPKSMIFPKKFLGEAEEKGIEGWIIKEMCRAPFWWKLKVEQTLDLIVTGLKMGNAGKFQNQVGALLGSVYINGELKEIAAVSGFTDKERFSLGDHTIGRIIEVKYQNIASKGRLRHPRFLRFREDKNEYECTLC